MTNCYKQSHSVIAGCIALVITISAAAANPAHTPFKAPPVTDSKPLTVVVLRDTTEVAPVFSPQIHNTQQRPLGQQQLKLEKPARLTRARRNRTRSRIRRKRIDNSWRDRILYND